MEPEHITEIPELAKKIVSKVLAHGNKPWERDIGDDRDAEYFIDHAITHIEKWDMRDMSEMHLRHALCDIAIALYLEGER